MARSLTYESIRSIVKELAPPNSVDPFTSHDMCKIFQGTAYFRGQKQKFHPKQRFVHLYRESPPDFALTYTWDTDFLTEMPVFMSNIKRLVNSNQGSEKFSKKFDDMTFWVDIFFIDQNDTEALIHNLISDSNEIYSAAPHHAVLLAFDTLRRGWCLVEIGYRVYAVLAEFRLDMKDLKRMLSGVATDKKHFSVKYMKEFSESFIVSYRLPQIIFGDSSDLAKDLFPFMTSEILDNMRTTFPQDRDKICEILGHLFGDVAMFDSVIHEFASGAIKIVAEGRHMPVHKHPSFPKHNTPQARFPTRNTEK
jgi:hypothetical protein